MQVLSRTLIAYFSATGIIERLSETLAKAINGDLTEIKAKVPYTAVDLNWNNKESYSSVEMSNKSSRPEIEDNTLSMEKYDTIIVAFPIWWYTAPTIVNTFLEKYDLTGKKIVAIATSGGSGLGHTVKDLEASDKGATVVAGKVFRANASENELKTWFESL